MKLKIDTIVIEGVDKTGKDILADYISLLSNYRYSVKARGVISQSVYEILFHRKQYERECDDHTLYVLLDADIEDLNVRFEITNEPDIDIEQHLDAFREAFNTMTIGKYNLMFNSSLMTPYKIAKAILEYVDELNGIE